MDLSRAAAFAAAVAVHAAMLAALLAARIRLSDVREPPATTITFFPASLPAREPLRRQPAAPDERRRSLSRARPREPAEPPAVREPPRPSAPITIDWTLEARRSAERQIAAADASDRQASALASRPREGAIPLDTAPPPAPEFGWSPMADGRIQRTEDGGTVLRISERCVIVLSALMPICSIGRLPVNGELFEHMRDPPEMGDWKD